MDAARDPIPRDARADARYLITGGGGCDCEVGASKPDGTVSLSTLIGLALLLVRFSSRRPRSK